MPIRLPAKKPIASSATDEPAPPPSIEAPSELLSIQQAAAFIGVAPVTVRRWVKQRLLHAWRAGGQIRIDKIDLIKFMQSY